MPKKDYYHLRDQIQARATRAALYAVYRALEGQYDTEEGPSDAQVDIAMDAIVCAILGANDHVKEIERLRRVNRDLVETLKQRDDFVWGIVREPNA
jgi:hypothetical protein